MSQGENGSDEEVTVSIVDQTEIQMSQGENGSDEEALQSLTSTIIQKIGEGVQKTESFFSSASIYRMPEYLRMHKESAYTPGLIAIGPLHRKDKHLQTPLQHVKMSYTNHLLSRLTAGMEDQKKTKFMVLKGCLAEMKTLVDDAKKCYAEEVTLNEEMLLVDGCFILEFLYRFHSFKRPQETDPICGNNLIVTKVVTDLILLENQIPFFVLEKLFQLTVEKIQHHNWSITDYVKHSYDGWLSPIRKSDNSSSTKTWCSPSECVLRVIGCTTAAAEEEAVQSVNIDDRYRTAKYYHILHNLHDSYLPHDHQTKNEKSRLIEMPSASELVYAGVKFVPDAGNNLFKFNFIEPKGLFRWFYRARFVIPPLVIYDSTESLLRNLIALEQFCPGVPQHVSSYATVMDMLVNTDKDVQVLEKAGVLTNWLGATEDATDLFNNLCKEIMLGSYFDDTRMKATEYTKRFWPKNMAHVRRTYFDSPWTFIAFGVGFIAFVISLVGFARDFGKKG